MKNSTEKKIPIRFAEKLSRKRRDGETRGVEREDSVTAAKAGR